MHSEVSLMCVWAHLCVYTALYVYLVLFLCAFGRTHVYIRLFYVYLRLCDEYRKALHLRGKKKSFVTKCVCVCGALLCVYGVATIGRLLTIVGLFCRISSFL